MNSACIIYNILIALTLLFVTLLSRWLCF